MALKKKIDEETFKALPKDVQTNYTKSGDNYILDLEGDDAEELKRGKDRANEEAKEAKKAQKAAEKKLAELEEQIGDGDKEKDIAKLTKAFDAKLKVATDAMEAAKKESVDKIAARDALTKKSMIDAASKEIATKISTMPTIMARFLADRLSVEISEEGEAALVVLDAKGKASSLTIEQLQKEFSTNKEYAGMIIGSKASGSGTPRQGTERTPSSAGTSGDTAPDLSKMKVADLTQVLKDRKASQGA